MTPVKNKQKIKLIVLTGPTASGKTDLSLRLAKKFNCEIISADSRQVYRGMDIGTDKIRLRNNKAGKIRHHLINITSPKRTVTVAGWKRLAKQAISDIVKRNRVPLVVGGTAFYIEALVFGLNFPEVEPNRALRDKLKRKSAESLFQALQNLDPRRAKEIDKNNKPRLIRAIEIAKTLGKVPKISKKSPYNTLMLGIKKPNASLKAGIDRRVDERSGRIIKEIKTLRATGVSFPRLINFGMEYKFYSLYLLGKISKEEAVKQSKTATWQFAKRQYTYFKKLPIKWVNNQKKTEKEIKNFINQNMKTSPF